MMENVTAAVLILVLWEIIWKGFALWRAAKNDHKGWFIALLVVNSLGILPAVYLFFFSKTKKSKR